MKWSPPVDYVKLVMLPLLAKMGVNVSMEVVTRGHYPRGGGIVRVGSSPSGSLKGIVGLKGGRTSSIVGVSHTTKLPSHIAQRQASAAVQFIEEKGLQRPDIEIESREDSSCLSPGSGIVLAARLEDSSIVGGDCLGERGRSAEEVGRFAALRIIEEVETGCFLDRHMGDMIIPYLSLADGVSDVSISRITQHTLTNISVAETIAGIQFDPVGDLGKQGRLKVNGLSLRKTPVDASPKEPRLIEGS